MPCVSTAPPSRIPAGKRQAEAPRKREVDDQRQRDRDQGIARGPAASKGARDQPELQGGRDDEPGAIQQDDEQHEGEREIPERHPVERGRPGSGLQPAAVRRRAAIARTAPSTNQSRGGDDRKEAGPDAVVAGARSDARDPREQQQADDDDRGRERRLGSAHLTRRIDLSTVVARASSSFRNASNAGPD